MLLMHNIKWSRHGPQYALDIVWQGIMARAIEHVIVRTLCMDIPTLLFTVPFLLSSTCILILELYKSTTAKYISYGHDVMGMTFSLELKKGKEPYQIVHTLKVDKETKQYTQEILFNFIAQSIADFIKEQNITTKLPLGFTFSFPVKQHSLTSGDLIRWTKDYKATGAVGKDVVQLLKEAFIRRGVSVLKYEERTNFLQKMLTLICPFWKFLTVYLFNYVL